jgi:hypothetical protein
MTIEDAVKLKVDRQQKYFASSSTGPTLTSTAPVNFQAESNITYILYTAVQILVLIILCVLLVIFLKCMFDCFIKKKTSDAHIRAGNQIGKIVVDASKKELDSVSVVM